jgi:nucleolar protein 56
LTGINIGAKMIAKAGSIEKMAFMPASTIQLLGAEEALFRHIKTGARPPKYGILLQHILVAKAKRPDKGKVAKALADKISIAIKVDFFKGEFIGDRLKRDLEKRFS